MSKAKEQWDKLNTLINTKYYIGVGFDEIEKALSAKPAPKAVPKKKAASK